MPTSEMADRETLRLNDLDWDLLEVLSDGKRYTPKHLYADVPELEEHGDDWIRSRIGHLHEHGLIERVGTSSMYVISDWGEAALDLRDDIDEDEPPKDFIERVMRHAADQSDGASDL